MTQSWDYSIVGSNSLIYGYPFSVVIADTWSISTEFLFYLVYPLFCFAIARLRKPWQSLAVAGVLVTGVLVLLRLAYDHGEAIDQFGVQHFGPIAGLSNGYQDLFLRWLIYFAPYSRLPEFLLGCLIAALYQQLESREPSLIERGIGQFLPYVAIIGIIGFVLIITSSRNPFPFLPFLHQNFGSGAAGRRAHLLRGPVSERYRARIVVELDGALRRCQLFDLHAAPADCA